ncbi:BTP domain-containing protein [Heracleum sosnowskyi]|uniref:BTP domain-containing protein n=1 Tax=Heracleum sosnowskyi TaxID=360622 RepID=A0AAD8I0C0_9APIA|nr:BTP domain-containing protein [Heracleum sosnowskyi]
MKSQTPPSQSSSPYHYAVTRVAVGQICRSIGFKSVQNSALSIITDVAGKYLQAIASAAVSAANAAGRTDSNIVDIVAALEYLCSSTGFPGGSDVNLGFCSSGPLIDVMKFVKYNDEIPFAKPLRMECLGEKISYSSARNCESGRSYVPKWLPLMPEIREKEVKRRELWPCFDDHDNRKMGVVVEGKSVGNGKRKVLPVKRGKVKFKIKEGGKGFISGLRKGGKRVLGESWGEKPECSSVGDSKKIVSYYVRRKKVRKIKTES